MKNRSSKVLGFAIVLVAAFGFAPSAFAHVVVTPNQVGIGSFNTFTISVPTEMDVPTISVKLLLPPGLQEVVPNVKPGWSVSVKQTGTGDDADVTEIDWTGGSIPVGERDQFAFSAQVPADPTALDWKAYQTYADGSVVSWDQAPAGNDDSTGDVGPYSVTNVIDDLVPAPAPTADTTPGAVVVALIFSLIAIILSAIALDIVRRAKKAK